MRVPWQRPLLMMVRRKKRKALKRRKAGKRKVLQPPPHSPIDTTSGIALRSFRPSRPNRVSDVIVVPPPFYSPIFKNHVINANNLGKQKVGMIFDEEMILHKNHKDYHPERPERVMAIYLNLIKKGIYKELTQLDFEPAENKHLEYEHPISHIQKVKDSIYSVNTKNYKE